MMPVGMVLLLDTGLMVKYFITQMNARAPWHTTTGLCVSLQIQAFRRAQVAVGNFFSFQNYLLQNHARTDHPEF